MDYVFIVLIGIYVGVGISFAFYDWLLDVISSSISGSVLLKIICWPYYLVKGIFRE